MLVLAIDVGDASDVTDWNACYMHGKIFRDLVKPGSYDFPARDSSEYTVQESREKRASRINSSSS